MNKTAIAILGATSHIAKGLISNFAKEDNCVLHLFTRSREKTVDFLASINQVCGDNLIVHEGYGEFNAFVYDVIINCIGIGTLKQHQGHYEKYFTVIEEYDNLIINYLLDGHPDTLYINFSSGAVYGRNFQNPVDENSEYCLRVNHVVNEECYTIAKINSEAKHRAFSWLKIVDLRLFSYFSRFADLSDGYFISEILNSILSQKTLSVSPGDLVRDYLHPDDLFATIKLCLSAGKINTAFDLGSAKPVEKKEILEYFAEVYGFKYEFSGLDKQATATGIKNVYYSTFKQIESLGFQPRHTSLDTIKSEAKYILNK